MITAASLSLPPAAEPPEKAIDGAATQTGATDFSGLLFFILATPQATNPRDLEPGQRPALELGDEEKSLRCACALEPIPSSVNANGIMTTSLAVETIAASDRPLLLVGAAPGEVNGGTLRAEALTSSLTSDANSMLTKKPTLSESPVCHRESSLSVLSGLARDPESATREGEAAGFELAQNAAPQNDQLEILIEDLSAGLETEQARLDANRSGATVFGTTQIDGSETELAPKIEASPAAASGDHPQRGRPIARENMTLSTANGLGASTPLTVRDDTRLDLIAGLMATDSGNRGSRAQQRVVDAEAEFASVAGFSRVPTADARTAQENFTSLNTQEKKPGVTAAAEPTVGDFSPLKLSAANARDAGGGYVASSFDTRHADLNGVLPMEEDDVPQNPFAKGGEPAPRTGEAMTLTSGSALYRAEATAADSRLSTAWRPAVERIAGEIVAHIRVNKREAVIQLDPPELGKIHIALHVDGDKLHARILTEGQEAKNLLEQHIQELRQSLQNQRLDLVEVRVDNGNWLNGRGDHPHGGQQQTPNGDQERQGTASVAVMKPGETAHVDHLRAEQGRVSMWA